MSQKLTAFVFCSTYLDQSFTECMSNNNNKFCCIDMPDVTACYGMPFDFIALFEYFHTVLFTIYV